MPRLTLRTLLAYIDDTLDPVQASDLGKQVAASDEAKKLIERIKKVTRRRGLTNPVPASDEDDVSDPNTVAEYLSDTLRGPQLRELEETCLASDVNLAEVAACHQILTLLLTEPVRVPPSANQRMYRLVDPPTSDPHRKPGRTIPVSGVALPPSQADADDPDAPLLLGMKRYGASESWAGRIGLVAAVGGVAAFLALAVFMALPHAQPSPPDTSAVVALGPGPSIPVPVVGPGTVIPPPKPVDGGGKKPDDGGKKEGPPPLPPPDMGEKKEPEPKGDGKLDAPIGKPIPAVGFLGRVDGSKVLLVTRGGGQAGWRRLDEANSLVPGNDFVMALPGYTAELKLDSGVTVHLWGNTPDPRPTNPLVLQSRVRFHQPPAGYAADLTLDEGRIYLSTYKGPEAKVRVRLSEDPGMVWDVAIRDNKTEVLVQKTTAFVPGAKYAREGGDPPKTEARLVLLRGRTGFASPTRKVAHPEKYENLPPDNEIVWDTASNALSEPRPMKKEELLPDRIPTDLVEAVGKALQEARNYAVKDAKGDGVAVRMKELLLLQPQQQNVLRTRLAVFGMAALADGPDAGDRVRDLFDDALSSTEKGYARQAGVMALSSWVARDPRNSKILFDVLKGKGWDDADSDAAGYLLRGYSSLAERDPQKVDDLVKWLDSDKLLIRESALANLLAFFDLGDPEARGPVTDIAQREVNRAGADQPRLKAWENFLNAWQKQAEVIKEKMAKK